MGLLSTIGAASGRAFGLTRVGVLKDLYFNLVTLLLPGNGTNGAQNNTFLDSGTANSGSGFTITRNGDVTQGTFSPFSQTGWSNYSAASSYVTSSSIGTTIGTADFCLEAWVYAPDTSPAACAFIVLNNSSGYNLFLQTSSSAARFLSFQNPNTGFEISGGTVSNNTWTHIVGTRQSGNNRLFVDGKLVAYSANDTRNYGTAGTIQIAGSIAEYVSNARVILGNGNIPAAYQTSTTTLNTQVFTPPTTPLTAVTGTALLTAQDNRFKDNSTNNATFTITGAPSVQAFSPFAPTAAYDAATVGGSGYFDGTGDYLNVASNTALTFGTGDFTVEGWFYANALGGQPTILNNGSDAAGLVITMLSSKIYAYFVGAGNVFGSSGATIVTNTWYHFAWVRSGSTNTFYLNGAVYGATYSSAGNHSSTGGVGIGYSVAGTAFAAWNGYIANVRMVKGTAVYTGAFTPPIAPVTTSGPASSYSSTTNVNTTFTSTNTSLLTNFTNAGITDATAKNVLETEGGAQISTTQSKFGGSSMYFDGTGDYLTSYNGGGLFRLGTVYTIEMWFYTTTVAAGTAGLINFATTVSGNTGLNLYRSSAEIVCNDGASAGTGPSSGASSVSANTWTYLAVVCNGTTTKIYLDGVEKGSYTGTTGSANSMTYVTIGAFNDKTSPFSGYIDDLRVTRGVARTITTPTAAFALQ